MESENWMSHRIFLVAAPFARLAARAQGALRIMEGHFPVAPERRTSVVIAGETAALVVTSVADGSIDRTDIPRAHAEALLAVTAGRVDCLQTSLTLDRRPVRLSRIVSPGLLDLLTVDFASDEEARAFAPPDWFGPEVSDEPGYRSGALALQGLPEAREITVSNAGLDSLLDALENRASRQAAQTLTAPVEKPRPAPEPEAAETDDPAVTAIEDDVIRELARSLRPRRG
jgi:CYTH domain-containing protein